MGVALNDLSPRNEVISIPILTLFCLCDLSLVT